MAVLRILHVVAYYEHAWAYGGIPRAVTTMTHGLARRGHHVTVCTTDACDERARVRAPHTSHAAPGRVDVHAFPNLSNRLAYRWQLFAPLGLSAALRAQVREVDVAHLHACRNLPVANAARALTRAGIPYVISPHGTAPIIERRFLAKRLFDLTAGRGYLAGAARVLAVSEAERAQLAALGLDNNRVAVIPNAVDEREFEPPPDGRRFRAEYGIGSAPLVLLLAKLTPRKGAHAVLRAFAALDRPEARLMIAGSDMGSGLTAAALAADPRVRQVGLLTGRARLEALAAADVVVYPATAEVFGLVPVEALLAGSPVVVSNDSGAGEIIGSVGGGHIVPPGDDESLRGAIDSMLGATALWRRRARTAAARARQRFRSDIVCQQIESLYECVLAGRRQERRSA